MAQLIVRNLEDDVREKLKDLARSQGQSMEETVRDILRNAVVRVDASETGLGTRLAQRFAVHRLDQDIQELRGQHLEPPSFKK